MAKGDQKILNSPFQVWVIKVDQYNRVRVPLHEVRSHLPWLPDKNTQFDCVAMPGPSGGIELVAAAAHQIVVAQFTAAIHGAQRPIREGNGWRWPASWRQLGS